MSEIVLNGITWGHSRGITPLLAASQRFSELNPQVTINWKKRTLQEFADFPIEKLTTQYDLLIIDHPWIGCASATKCVLPLEEYLSKEYLKNQLDNSVGNSHLSYHYGGHQWALAIDAATPVASYRADLLLRDDIAVPDTWRELLSLAQKKRVAVPGIPIDLLMNFYMFCLVHGAEPFLNEHEVIDKETGMMALDSMKELWSLVDVKMYSYNPVNVAELMSSTDDYSYCPFAYGYSNYSRQGYASSPLTYGNLVKLEGNRRLRSTLGGTGLAVSATTQNKELATNFTAWVVSEKIQSALYVQHGGQPGHRSAWNDPMANSLCNNFFSNTLDTLDNAYQRPRYNGYLHFQDYAGIPVQQFLLHKVRPEKVLEEINKLYRESRQNLKS
ncbi:extracellular solute-binding protein [Inquilinus sp. KBS0705]|nr:extracellular solute-binding protein [Inquilinus sp. KBS0705]